MKKFMSVLMVLLLLVVSGVNVYAAEIGVPLTGPEAGWRRYDNTNAYFIYMGSQWLPQVSSNSYFYNSDVNTTWGNGTGVEDKNLVKFQFRGSKFRLVAQNAPGRTTNVQVKIDGKIVGSYSQDFVSWKNPQALCYEKTGLEYGVHTVELLNMDNTLQFVFDATDIDDTGELLPYTEREESALSVVLDITEQIQLSVSDELADNTDYTWTSTDPTVVTVDAAGKVTAIGEGLAYINAKNTDGTFEESIPVRVSRKAAEKRLAIHLNVGDKKRLYLAADSSLVNWTSIDESTATVSASGEVTAVKKGLVIIQGEYQGKTYQIYVRVN